MTTRLRTMTFSLVVFTDRDRTSLFSDTNQDVPSGAHR